MVLNARVGEASDGMSSEFGSVWVALENSNDEIEALNQCVKCAETGLTVVPDLNMPNANIENTIEILQDDLRQCMRQTLTTLKSL